MQCEERFSNFLQRIFKISQTCIFLNLRGKNKGTKPTENYLSERGSKG